jgi:hypothetical protein
MRVMSAMIFFFHCRPWYPLLEMLAMARMAMAGNSASFNWLMAGR